MITPILTIITPILTVIINVQLDGIAKKVMHAWNDAKQGRWEH